MNRVTVFLLLGGTSRRMGQPKSELIYRGQPFWAQIAESLSTVGTVVLSLRQNSGRYPYPTVTDVYDNCGALGGMISCLRVCQTPLAFFCACDMPLLTADVPTHLMSMLPAQAQAVVPVSHDGHAHPLCAIYRREVLPILEQQLAAGDLRVLHLLEHIRVHYLPIAQNSALERQLMNTNTPEEYRALCQTP